MKALRLAEKTYVDESYILANGPGFMELEKLRKEITYIKEKTFDNKGHIIRELTD